ncbi:MULTISPECIES: hypothetical protein [unclassified Mucilaginibacter]|uniref:hypothetical protein n=1 Tax=unclassified Mucilaginibacter TaxID=2617802 RepID=UPI0033937D4D
MSRYLGTDALTARRIVEVRDAYKGSVKVLDNGLSLSRWGVPTTYYEYESFQRLMKVKD